MGKGAQATYVASAPLPMRPNGRAGRGSGRARRQSAFMGKGAHATLEWAEMRWIALGFVVAGAMFTWACGARHVPASASSTAPLLPIRTVCSQSAVPFPPKSIFLRAFKQERELELWGAGSNGEMHLLRTYTVAAASGGPGPKRREGDLQVPEGVYHVDRFNPHSRFHLSLGINYPNRADRMFADPANPGGDIFIHGNQVSIGCLAMTDTKIDEIYSLATAARQTIPVHIFPCRMAGQAYRDLKRGHPEFALLWNQLQPIYARFEETHRVPQVSITRKGAYALRP